MVFPTTEWHFKKYEGLCDLWGFAFTRDTVLGLTREEMAQKLRADADLNNIPLERWDTLARVLAGRRKPDGHAASLGEAVCAVKHAARVWCGGRPVFVMSVGP